MINIKDPVFVIGAPKTGSTSLHIEFSNSNKFNYAGMKDTHLLSSKDFSLKEYSKYFKDNNYPIMEVDQNAAIYKRTFINIEKYFENSTLIYVVRNPRDRFFSAYKWLLKVGLVDNLEDAILNEEEFMIKQGLYKENIEKNILLNCKSRIIIVKFEDLVKEDGITFNKLKEMLNIKTSSNEKKPMLLHNKSTKPRSKLLVQMLKWFYRHTKYITPNSLNQFIKSSPIINKMLFNDRETTLPEEDLKRYHEYKAYFHETEKFINNLDFKNGIFEIEKRI